MYSCYEFEYFQKPTNLSSLQFDHHAWSTEISLALVLFYRITKLGWRFSCHLFVPSWSKYEAFYTLIFSGIKNRCSNLPKASWGLVAKLTVSNIWNLKTLKFLRVVSELYLILIWKSIVWLTLDSMWSSRCLVVVWLWWGHVERLVCRLWTKREKVFNFYIFTVVKISQALHRLEKISNGYRNCLWSSQCCLRL